MRTYQCVVLDTNRIHKAVMLIFSLYNNKREREQTNELTAPITSGFEGLQVIRVFFYFCDIYIELNMPKKATGNDSTHFSASDERGKGEDWFKIFSLATHAKPIFSLRSAIFVVRDVGWQETERISTTSAREELFVESRARSLRAQAYVSVAVD